MDEKQRELLETIFIQNFDEATKLGGFSQQDVATIMIGIGVGKFLDQLGYLPTLILVQELCVKLTTEAAHTALKKPS